MPQSFPACERRYGELGSGWQPMHRVITPRHDSHRLKTGAALSIKGGAGNTRPELPTNVSTPRPSWDEGGEQRHNDQTRNQQLGPSSTLLLDVQLLEGRNSLTTQDRISAGPKRSSSCCKSQVPP